MIGADGSRRDRESAELGSAMAASGSTLSLDARDPCRVRSRGSRKVASDVHAVDLGGGELRVVTASGEVIVQGTVFSVALEAAS